MKAESGGACQSFGTQCVGAYPRIGRSGGTAIGSADITRPIDTPLPAAGAFPRIFIPQATIISPRTTAV
jgi:hypothetical protein